VGVTGTTDITFTVAEDELPQAVALVQRANEEIGANEVLSSGGLAKLSIVGTGMLGTPGIAARMFKTLAEQKINIEMISTSEIRITCLVDRARAEDGVRALHTAFDLDQQ
jgi:aspartate kinase